MNKEIIEKLSYVENALEDIEVKGKRNLLNLGGCITLLEEIRKYLSAQTAEIEDKRE